MPEQDFFSQLRYPKDVRVDEIILISHDGQAIDIYELVNELNLYEDIYSNCISGDVVLEDGQNLPSTVPLNGNEKIVFSFFTPGDTEKISLAMNVYKISERVFVHEKKQIYSLHFTSREMFKNATTKVSQAFEGTQSEIVQQIFSSPDGLASERPLAVDNAAHTTRCVIPRWAPLQAINWLAQRSVGSQFQNADFMFFETVDGFNFRSLASLIADNNQVPEDDKITYYYRQNLHHDLTKTGAYPYKRLRDDFYTIETYNVKPTFDTLAKIHNGMFAGRLLIHDIFNRSFQDLSFDYLEHFDSSQELDSNLDRGAFLQRTPNLDQDSFNELQDSNIHIVPEHSFNFGNDIESTKRYPLWLLQRQSEMQQYNNLIIEIQVPGDSRRRVGEVVDIVLPSQQPFDDDQFVEDPFLSGRYIITSIRHKVQVDNYVMVLELTKDSFFTELPSGE